VPPGLPLEQVGKALAKVPGVVEVHDLHVWSLSSRRIALSAHVTLRDLALWPQTLAALRQAASEQGIDHPTFQPEIHTQTLRWLGRPETQRTVAE
jgi:cobalt-zinc-cadmium efflux system protein